jgi:SAM-dependent methyltransferase
VGLNVGSGDTRLHSSIINLDIQYSPSIDCFGKAEYIPFKDSSFTFVMTQETLEHVQKPYLAIEEMYRVLQKQGILYCQLPFIIGYHPGPTDFWRFSKEGICELVEQAGFIVEEVAIAVGPATGFYRIAVEFLAVIMSRLEPRAYRLSKGLMAVGLYPVKWLDTFLIRSEQADRIPGGYYVIARKPDQ